MSPEPRQSADIAERLRHCLEQGWDDEVIEIINATAERFKGTESETIYRKQRGLT